MSPPDELDDETRDLVLEAAKRLSAAEQKKPLPVEIRELRQLSERNAGRIADMEEARSMETIATNYANEFDARLWSIARLTLIKWGIPAFLTGILTGAGWAFVQFVKSITE